MASGQTDHLAGEEAPGTADGPQTAASEEPVAEDGQAAAVPDADPRIDYLAERDRKLFGDPRAAQPTTEPAKPRFSFPGRKRQTDDITFDDLLLEMEVDSKFNDELLTDRVKELDGQRVRIRGFMWPAVMQTRNITNFPLIRNLQCKFGPGGQAYHVILVDMKEGTTTDFSNRPVTVEGILKVEPYEGADGNTWSVYRMAADRAG